MEELKQTHTNPEQDNGTPDGLVEGEQTQVLLEKVTNELETNLGKFESEVAAFGGMQEFQDYYNGAGRFAGQNKAGQEVAEAATNEKQQARLTKTLAAISTAMVGIGAYVDYLVSSSNGHLPTQFEQLKNLKELYATDKVDAVTVTAFFAIGAAVLAGAVRNGIQYLKERRHTNQVKEKFAATGVTPTGGNRDMGSFYGSEL
jgi:hypothetical protein